jgi:hypothetical protein
MASYYEHALRLEPTNRIGVIRSEFLILMQKQNLKQTVAGEKAESEVMTNNLCEVPMYIIYVFPGNEKYLEFDSKFIFNE